MAKILQAFRFLQVTGILLLSSGDFLVIAGNLDKGNSEIQHIPHQSSASPAQTNGTDFETIHWKLFKVGVEGQIINRVFSYNPDDNRLQFEKNEALEKYYSRTEDQLVITDLLINSRSYQPGTGRKSNSTLQLRSDQSSIVLEFLFTVEGNQINDYRYTLEGFNDEWYSLSNKNIAEYINLMPGDYRFLIQKRDQESLSEVTVAELPFTISKPVLASLWFQYGVVLLIAGLLYSVICVRKYYRTEQEMLRLRIARDLHDDVSSTLNSISFFADAIESRSLNKVECKRFLHLISDSSREAKERISDIIWVIHPQDDDWDTLLLKCKRYASDVLECKGVAYRFSVEGNPPAKLTMALKKNTWLIFRELITNIAKHANPSNVEIRFKVESGTIKLSVNDDGRGFDPHSPFSEGYGLKNIKSRVENLKGNVFLDTKLNSGTHWNLQIPI